MTDTKLRWLSARDAWRWAEELETTRAMLEAVDVRYVVHTAAPGFLITTARDLLRECAEREVADSRRRTWSDRAVLWTTNFLVYLGLTWWRNRTLVVGDFIFAAFWAVGLTAVFAVIDRWRIPARKRGQLAGGYTTASPFDKARDHRLPDDPSSELTVAYVGWRTGALAQATRILLEPKRLDAARLPIAYEDDICLAALYLSGATELLKGLSDYVEAEKSVANCGE